MKRTIYRDRDSGRFVSHATWNRSKAHGGTRYVRQRIEVKTTPKDRAMPAGPRRGRGEEIEAEQRVEFPFEPYELEGSADYEEPE